MRLLIAEDEADLNRILCERLRKEGYAVDSCYDGIAAVQYTEQEHYDGAVLDIMLPGKSGFDVLREMREKGDQTPVLFLTALSDTRNIVRGLDLGASDYMVKPFELTELLARIRVMLRNPSVRNENTYICGDIVINTSDRSVTRAGDRVDLTAKEYALLLYLVRNKNMVLTTIEDAEQYAENVSWGAYKLNESLIHSISSREGVDLAIAEDLLKQFDQNTKTAYERFYGVQKNQQPAAEPAQTAAVSDSAKAVQDSINNAIANAENKKDLEYIHQASNVLYFGRVPGSPEVGDVRVTFEKVVPAKVTVMAVVDGDTFKPFKAKNGKRFQTLVMGKKSGDEIIEAEKEANNMWTWALRIIGILMVIGGLKGIFGFIETILKVVPFIAGIFGWGIGLICTVVGIAWSLIVIAIAWLFYRPLLGISLLVLAGFLVWVFAFKGKDKLKELAAKAKEKGGNPAPAPAPNE